MSKYKPSTLDDFEVLNRRREAQRRQLVEQSTPTGSNVYATTEKVQDLDLTGLRDQVDALERDKQDKLTAGDNVQISAANVISATDTTYDDATTSVHGLMSTSDKQKLDQLAVLPVGAMVIMRSQVAPALHGTWTLVTGFHLPMTNVSSTTFYLYERTA